MSYREYNATFATIATLIVDSAWEHFPEDEASRLYLYDRVADNFSALARVLRGSRSDKVVNNISEVGEEPDYEEPITQEEG